MELDSPTSSTESWTGIVGSVWSNRTARIIAIVAVALIAGIVYYGVTSRTDPLEEARKEAERVVAAVGKLMVLPPDEEPIIATVADPTQLADQPFFSNALTGDKVLIYNVARKAILFREAGNIIVDVAPLSPAQPSPSPKQ